jgi:hypothetical protein
MSTNKNKIILRKFIKDIPEHIDKNEVSIRVEPDFYDSISHLLKDGSFKGIKIYC